MKEKVDLNNNGLCIESTAKILIDNKWVHRHISCKKPVDLSFPILFIYKNKRDKQHNQYKLSLVLESYVGFESGFEYKRRCNTLCIITGTRTLLLSFEYAENLVVWKTWLKNTCGHSTSLFMQLKSGPENICHTAMLKEVRCHIHDSRLAIVYGRPQEVLFSCNVNLAIVDINEQNLITIMPDLMSPTIHYVFLCAKSNMFKMYFEAARHDGLLHRLLSRQNLDGDWLSGRGSQKRSLGDHSSQLTVNISELASLMRTPEPTHNYRIHHHHYPDGSHVKLNKEKSKSSYMFSSPQRNGHNVVSRANSTAAYYANTRDRSPTTRDVKTSTSCDYINIGSRASSFKESPPFMHMDPTRIIQDEVPDYCNLMTPEPEDHIYDVIQTSPQTSGVAGNRSTSLPEYVNLQLTSTPVIIRNRNASGGKRSAPSSPPKEPQRSRSGPGPFERMRRRSDNSVNHTAHPSTSRGRSIPDMAFVNDEPENRHDTWQRAKKRFLSAFKPKSQSDLRHQKKLNRQSITKSSSVGALQFASSRPYFERQSSDSVSEPEEAPPQLHLSMVDQLFTGPSLSSEDSPPEGLVRPSADVVLKMRGGVQNALQRRLGAPIRGSFSKYDGERSAHGYQPNVDKSEEPNMSPSPVPVEEQQPGTSTQPPPRPPKSNKMDGIASAVNRGQEKLKLSDRRASNVSFHKINLNVALPVQPQISPSEHSGLGAPRRSIIPPHLTSPRHSNSYSDATRSSNESLSSDARSRISIRRRNASPPRAIAPVLSIRPSDETAILPLRRQRTESFDSLNSEQTARSMSPPRLTTTIIIRDNSTMSLASSVSRRTINGSNINYCDLALPRPPPSNSSSNSYNSRIEYVQIDPISTKAAQEANRSNQTSFERTRLKSCSLGGMSTLRRQSQGHGSSASDTMSVGKPAYQGFFKKYKKMRRNKSKGITSSMSQLHF